MSRGKISLFWVSKINLIGWAAFVRNHHNNEFIPLTIMTFSSHNCHCNITLSLHHTLHSFKSGTKSIWKYIFLWQECDESFSHTMAKPIQLPLPLMVMVMARVRWQYFSHTMSMRQHDGKQHDDSQRNTFFRIREIRFQTNSSFYIKQAWCWALSYLEVMSISFVWISQMIFFSQILKINRAV